MRDILTEIFAGQPFDPMEAARTSMRPQRKRRFYTAVDVVEGEGGFGLTLDTRPVKTPARRALAAPDAPLTDAIADEWRAQGEFIEPASMPLTRLANSIIDGVADGPGPVADEIAKYLASDLVFYRADVPEGLVARQAAVWEPVLDWARVALGANFAPGNGLVFVVQTEAALTAARSAIPRGKTKRDLWRLGATHSITTLTGSALIALMLLHGKLAAEDGWAAAHVDEDWNMEFWGRDDVALARRAARFAEMAAAATVLGLLRA